MRKLLLVLALLPAPAVLVAQQKPLASTTMTTTDTSADSLHVGCAVGSSTCTGGIKAGPIVATTGVFTGTSNTVTITSNSNPGLKFTTSPAADGGSNIQFNTSNTVKNWQIGANLITSSAFTLTPSTATGGTTYTTPVFSLLPTGVFDFNAKWGINAAGDLTIGASSHIALSVGVPSIVAVGPPVSFEGGTFDSDSLDYAMVLTWGAAASGVRSGTVNFGHTFANVPIPQISTNSAAGTCKILSVSTTQLGFSCSVAIASGDKVYISVTGR